ncbi:MAG: CPBP family intramembrane metalloprotease [Verrucomicrobiales bacterium]|nr:CPBP family intramembrane metalloprotease [Verrucomicrobiales bacterium]
MIEIPPSSRLGPPALPNEKAGLWAWPLVVLSVFFIGWSVNLFSPDSPVAESGENSSEVDPADLAMLKIQSQVIIAAGTLSPAEAGQTLEELREMGGGDRGIASIAMLESFLKVPGSNPEKTAENISSEASEEMRELVLKAVTEGVEDGEREALKAYLGWFAELARAPGLDPPPKSTEIRTRALVFLLVVASVFLVALGAIIFGGVAIITMIVRQREGKKVSYFDKSVSPRGVMLECFAIYLGIMALGEVAGVAALRFGGDFQMLVSSPSVPMIFFGASVVIPFLWPIFRGIPYRAFLRSLGVHRGKGMIKEIGAGIIGYAGVAVFASIGISLTLLLTLVVGWFDSLPVSPEGLPGGSEAKGGPSPGPTTHPIVGWIYQGGVVERMLCLLLASGFAPLFEELFFRGALHRYLRGRFKFLVSAVLTGLIFAALHPQGWMAIPALTAMGAGFSMLREWRDSLIAPMVAHAVNNGILVGILCLGL